ncbi:hypothetical protein [Pedobacter sp. NJ-S-72]
MGAFDTGPIFVNSVRTYNGLIYDKVGHSGFQGTLDPYPLTADRAWFLPDGTGLLALKSDVPDINIVTISATGDGVKYEFIIRHNFGRRPTSIVVTGNSTDTITAPIPSTEGIVLLCSYAVPIDENNKKIICMGQTPGGVIIGPRAGSNNLAWTLVFK